MFATFYYYIGTFTKLYKFIDSRVDIVMGHYAIIDLDFHLARKLASFLTQIFQILYYLEHVVVGKQH